MKVADLIAALQMLPSDARVIVEDCMSDGDVCHEMYAEADPPEIRYLHDLDQTIQWDLTPTVEDAPGSETVVLIGSSNSDRVKLGAPVRGADGWTRFPHIKPM